MRLKPDDFRSAQLSLVKFV